MKHTPTSYRVVNDRFVVDESGNRTTVIAKCDSPKYAKFIARACNNNQNLIERLAHAVWVMRSWAQAAQEGSDQYGRLHEEADAAEAALKLARGE